MQYQLPNGRVVHLSVEQFLDLSDQDIQDLIACNAGDFITSPFYGSAINKRKKKVVEDDEQHDESIDFIPEEEDICKEKPILNQEDLNVEDFPDIPDEENNL